MVRRLIVALLSCSFGFATFAFSEMCVSQTVTLPQDIKETEKKDEPQNLDTIRSEFLLPASTKLWVSIPDAKLLEKHFETTQFNKLAKDPAIKPFIDGLNDQIKEWMKAQNVRMGMDVDDLRGVHSGEICIAGILPQVAGDDVKGTHGIVMLIDVSETYEEAIKLQAKINKQLVESGATQETKTMNEVEVIVSTIKRKRLRNNQTNHQAIVGKKWMLVSDNEQIFGDVLRRLAAPAKIRKAETLASTPAFTEVMKRTDLKPHASHVRWFIDPFGYIQLAQALEDENRENRVQRDDWALILKNQGMGAAKGIGGNVSIATGEHEVLHRTFTYAPRDQSVENSNRMFDLFDFSPVAGRDLAPPKWVPNQCSAYLSGSWNFQKALNSFGFVYDAFIGEEGSFDRLKSDFKIDPAMQLDIDKLVGLLDNRFTVVSATVKPINETSERIIIGFPIKGSPDYVYNSFKRATGGQEIVLSGVKVIRVDSDEPESGGDDPGPFDLPDDFEEEEEEEREFSLFEERFFTVVKDHLLVANNKDYLKQLIQKLSAEEDSKLVESPDYVQVNKALAKITNPENVGWRQFSRIDRVLETNYEMLRRGEMAKSQTVLARIVNQVFQNKAEEEAAKEGKDVDPEKVRQQKLDGSKLPADYAKSIAPYFGPMGWVMETEKDGWRITGCVLKKKVMTEVVQKLGAKKNTQR